MFLNDGTPGDQIELQSQLEGSAYGVQLVTFGDGTSLTAAQLLALEITGTTGADNFNGTSAADVLDGMDALAGSQDYEQGNGGGDMFVFDAGYGRLEINEDQFGTNIVPFAATK